MATRKQTAQEFIPSDDTERTSQIIAARGMPDTPPAIVERDEFEETEDEILANVIADLGGPGIDAKVNVYQLDQNRNKAFVRAYMPSEFSLESLQSEYGPGDYEIHVRKDGRLATRKVVKIATPKNPNPVSLTPHTGVGDTKIIEAMQNGFKEMGAMFANALSGLAANQPKAKSTMEMLQELQLMREIMGANVQAQQVDPLKILDVATNLAEKITPRTGEPGNNEILLEAIKNFGPILVNAAQQKQPLSLQNQPLPQIQQLPQTQQITETLSNHSENKGLLQMQMMKKYYLGLLVSQAQNDNDPLTYANMMLDIIGEEKSLELVNADNWFERLCAEEPRASGYKAWFESMRECIIELTKPESNDTTGITANQDEPGVLQSNDK